MSLDYTNRWEPVENTVYERLIDNSLLHTLTLDKKILKQTKILNSKLKKRRNLREYKQFLFLKRQSVREFKDNHAETDDESDLDHESYKRIYAENTKHQLRTFLKSCVRKTPLRTEKKSPQLIPKTRNKSSSLSKSSRSLSAAKSRSYSGENICKYLLRSRREVPTIERIAESPSREIISSLSNSNINQDSTQTDDDAVKKIHDIKATSVQIGTIDSISLDSECKSAVISDSAAVNCLEQITTPELRDDADNELGISLEFDDNSDESGNRKQDKYDVNTTIEDNVKTSRTTSKCLDNSKMGIKEKVDINHESDIDKPTDNLDRDSGNNSFSETDMLDDQHRMSPDNSISDDGGDNGTITDEQTSNKTRQKIVTIKSDEATSTVILCEDLNTPQSESQCEISSRNEKLSDSNLDNETRLELGRGKNQHENLNDEFHVESILRNGRSKLKILAIDYYERGHKSFNERHLRRLSKVRTMSNSDYETLKDLDKFVASVLPSEDKRPLRYSEANEGCSFALNESCYLNSSVDTEACSNMLTSTQQNLNEFGESELLPADEDQSQSDAFSEKCTSSEIQSQSLNQSLNSSISSFSSRTYDEDVKNTVKKQLLTEIESRLIDNQRNVENKSVSPGEEFLSTSSQRRKNIYKSSNEPLNTKNGFVKECNSLKVLSQNMGKHSDVGLCLLSSKPKRAKRRIVNSETDNHLSVNSPCASKQPQQHTNKQSEIILHEHKTPGDSSNQLQPDKSKKVEHSPKRKHRPRNLQEFAVTEALNQDTTKAYFRLKDISDDDEIWIADVPKMINPKDLENQTIILGGESVLRFGDDCYKVSSKPSKGVCNLSCALTTSKRKNDYKILNIRSQGRMKFCQKISVVSDSKLVPSELPSPKTTVPFPTNLKMRHPLFGANYEDKTS